MSRARPVPPATVVEYRICWRSPDSPPGLDRWETDSHVFADRAEAEATAERSWRRHHAAWPDRRDFAVVRTRRAAVRMFAAPAAAAGETEGGGT